MKVAEDGPFALEVEAVQKTLRFDAVLQREGPRTMWLALSPGKVPEEPRGCVLLMFDPSTGGDPVVQLASVYFDGKCAVGDGPELEQKTGTRSMLKGALLALRHLAKVERRWPHLGEIHLDDESTFRCRPEFSDAKIKTFATDLLVGDRTYYERHLNATLSSAAAHADRVAARGRIQSPIDVDGTTFWRHMTPTSLGGVAPVVLSRKQIRWIKAYGHLIVKFVDDVREAGGTWEDAFESIKDWCECEMFACCAEQLVRFFKLSRLMGALYTVKIDELPEAETSVVTRPEPRVVHVKLSRGGGGPKRDRAFRTLRCRAHSAHARRQ